MNDSESSPANEWNEDPTKVAWSPQEYENSLKVWAEAASNHRLSPAAKQGWGGRLQDRATRLAMASVARTFVSLRE